MLRFGILAAAAFALSGCDDAPATRSDLNKERVERINNHVRLQSKVETLEAEIRDLRRDLEFAEADIGKTGSLAAAVADQAANNARVANENAAKAMTDRGACGTRLVQVTPGVIKNERIPCTVKDLKP